MALWAQTGPVTVTLSAPVKGPVELLIRNHSPAAVTAYAVTLRYAAGENIGTRDVIWDSALELTTPAIEAHQAAVRRMPVPPANPSVALRAVVFADGRSSGEAAWVARILSQRRFALATIDELRQALPTAKPEELEAARREKLAAADPEQKPLVEAYYRLATPQHARDLELLRLRLAGSLPPSVN